MKTKKKSKKSLVCEDCGAKNKTVERGHCPYDHDVNEKETEVTLCRKCYQQRADDI